MTKQVRDSYYYEKGFIGIPVSYVVGIFVTWISLYPMWDHIIDGVEILTVIIVLSCSLGVLSILHNRFTFEYTLMLSVITLCLYGIRCIEACENPPMYIGQCHYDFGKNGFHWLGALLQIILFSIVYRFSYLIYKNKPLERDVWNLGTCVLLPIAALLLNIWWLVVYFPVNKIAVNTDRIVDSKPDFMGTVGYMLVFVFLMTSSLTPLAFVVFDDNKKLFSAIAMLYGSITPHGVLLGLILSIPRVLFHDITSLKMNIPECVHEYKRNDYWCSTYSLQACINGTWVRCCDLNVEGVIFGNRVFAALVAYLFLIAAYLFVFARLVDKYLIDKKVATANDNKSDL